MEPKDQFYNTQKSITSIRTKTPRGDNTNCLLKTVKNKLSNSMEKH